MKSLDQAVQKFKALKQKLKQISEEPQRKSTIKIYPQLDKQNNQNLQNKMMMSIPASSCIDDNKIRTQKKNKNAHKRAPSCNLGVNNNWSYSQKMMMSYRSQDDQNYKRKDKIVSMNNSRVSQHLSNVSQQLKQKQKTLTQINNLLEKKQQVLKAIQKKIGNTSTIEDLQFEKIINKNKKSIRAPNLFQMQVEGRKRCDSKTLTIRWKGTEY